MGVFYCISYTDTLRNKRGHFDELQVSTKMVVPVAMQGILLILELE